MTQSNPDANFELAVERMGRLSIKYSNKQMYEKFGDKLLDLYAFYKVATAGKNTKPKPGMFDIKGRKKWNAWTQVDKMNLSHDQAKAHYINAVINIVNIDNAPI